MRWKKNTTNRRVVMILTSDSIERYVEKCKKYASYSFYIKNFNACITFIISVAYLKYTFYLGYVDDELEELCIKLSKHIRRVDGRFVPRKDSVVFYDCFTSDNRGLTQQYLETLLDSGYTVTYICRKNINDTDCRIIKRTLESCSSASIIQVPYTMRKFEEAQWIYDTILKSSPSKLCMQILPESAVECVAFNALPKEIIRFQINLTDHAFWLGRSSLDYSFEFRSYGGNISYHKRGLSKDKILLMPFYPIITNSTFNGFPEIAANKVVFFSGGNYYKVVEKEEIFFKLSKRILESCPNAVILFAGTGDNPFFISEMAKKYDIEDRLIPVGNRSDIYECFCHSDIYINTYPIGGGLMCQYAAYCKKPIINYKNINIEECVAQKSACSFTFFSEEDFILEAIRLYKDSKYREEKGRKLHSVIVTKRDFKESLINSFEKYNSNFQIIFNSSFQPNDQDRENAISYTNTSTYFIYYMWKVLRHKLLLVSTWMYFDVMIKMIKSKLQYVFRWL